MKQSVGHGIQALGLLLHAIVTAGLVVYVVIMRGLTKVVVPGVARIRNRESPLRAVDIAECLCGFIMHLGIVVGTIATMPGLLSDLENMPTPSRVRALFLLAAAAGAVESLGIHSTHAACCCRAKGMDAGSTLASAFVAFSSNVVRLIPVALMELLILTVMFGPGIFEKSFLSSLNPACTWAVLLLFAFFFLGNLKLRATKVDPTPERASIDDAREQESLCGSHAHQSNVPNTCDIEREYGSMEEVSILSSKKNTSNISIDSVDRLSSRDTAKSDANDASCLERCRKALCQYCEGLRLSSDLLVLTLMAMLLLMSISSITSDDTCSGYFAA